MANQLRIINASTSAEPLYAFLTPNPAWQVADGFAALVSLIVPVDEIAGVIKEAIAAARAANAGATTGVLADLASMLDDAITWLSGTWVGQATTAAFHAGASVIKSIYDLYEKFSRILTMKTALTGIRDMVSGAAALDAAHKKIDGIVAAFEKVFADKAYKIPSLGIRGFNEISNNPLDYMALSGWAALANADTAHLTIYRKGKYLADFNAHAQSAYVCTDDLIWRIDGEDWGDRQEIIHGITPAQLADKPFQDVECHYLHDLQIKGDPKEGYKPEEILRIEIKPQHRVLPMNLRVDMTWRDQGFGNQKGQFIMALIRDGQLVKGSSGADLMIATGPAPHTDTRVSMEYPETSDFVNSSRPGDVIVFSAIPGAGGGQELHVKSLLVTLPTSTLIYKGPPFEKQIGTDPAIRYPYYTFPVVTHPHKAIPNRGTWTPKLKAAKVVVNWEAVTLYNSYELEKAKRGEEVESGTNIMYHDSKGNDSVRTVLEVWKDRAKTAEGNLWTNAPNPYGFRGTDLWLTDVPDSLLLASQLPRDSPDTPVEWAISIWYEKDNYWPIFRRDTHLRIDTFAIFVEYQW